MELSREVCRCGKSKEKILAKLYIMGLIHFKTQQFNFIGGDDGGCNSKMMTFANMDFVFVPAFVQALMVELGVID